MIALVSMPFSALAYPPLAPGLLKAKLQDGGLQCRVFYLNFNFAGTMGLKNYQLVAHQKSLDPHIGEWLFAAQAWDGGFDMADDRFLEMAGDTPFMAWHKHEAGRLLRMIRDVQVPLFLENAAAALLSAGHVEVVGFSCGFFQTNASLALIRHLKRLRPEIPIICGGTSFFGAMGRELMRAFDGIDAACLGEADGIVVPLFKALIDGREPENLAGLVYRDRYGALHEGPSCQPACAGVLEENPFPDFDEYFEALHVGGLDTDASFRSRVFIPMQSSRGCWKGEKQHCTFCGLTDLGHGYRMMSAGRAAECIRHLLRRYPAKNITINDLILPKAYYRQLLPLLAEDTEFKGASFWAEVQTTMPRRHVRMLAEAGFVFLQAGIESLSTHMLACMRKGVTAIKNVHFLKLCRTYNVHPMWCLLLRVPGERVADYRQMAALVPKIVHLAPPVWGGRVLEMQRFSPYFEQTGRWAVNIRPRPFYAALFPRDRVKLADVAYFFDADWLDLPQDNGDRARLLAVVKTWIDTWSHAGPTPLPNLIFENLPDGGMVLTDTRCCDHHSVMRLSFAQASLYRAMNDPISRDSLARLPAAATLGETAFQKTLDALAGAGIVLQEKQRYLGLALPADTPEPSVQIRRAMTENCNMRIKEI